MNFASKIRARASILFAPRQTLDDQNAWNLYGDIAWFGILSGVANSFLSVFVLRLGGSDVHVGLLSALPALIAIFASLPGSRLVEREKKPLSILIWSGFLNRAGYLAIALVPLALTVFRPDAIVVLVGLLTIPGAIATVAFTTMFGRAVKPEHRARVVSVRNIWLGITSTAMAFIGGKFLDYVIFPINYQILFCAAFAGSMMSLYYLTRIRLADAPSPQRLDAVPHRARDLPGMVHANDRYKRFVFASMIFQWGVFFPLPLYSIFWVRNLHATDGWIGLINTVGTGLTIFFYPVWARLATRYGNRPLLIASAAGVALYPLFTAFAPSIEWVLLISLIGGIFNPAYGLASFNGLLEVSPEQQRPSYIAIYNTLINVAAFIGPLLSTLLAQFLGIETTLLIGAGLRMVGAFMFWQQRVLARAEN